MNFKAPTCGVAPPKTSTVHRHLLVNGVRSLCMASLLVALCACALNPYVGNTRPSVLYPSTPMATPLVPGTLDYALQYANNTHDAYAAKLYSTYNREKILSGSLIGIGSAVLAAAGYGASKDLILGLSLGGATAYSLGTWNSSKDRLEIYLEGMKSMSCARAAISPLAYSPAQLQVIAEHGRAVGNAVTRASEATGKVTETLAVAKFYVTDQSPLLSSAERELAEMDGVFALANETLGRSTSLAHNVDGAGKFLEDQINVIKDQVDNALKGTLAELSQLPKVIQGISAYATIFAPGADFATPLANKLGTSKTAPTSSAQGAARDITIASDFALDSTAQLRAAQQALAQALGALRAARIQLASEVAAVKGLLDVGTPNDIKEVLKTCKVDVDNIKTDFELDRKTVAITAGQERITPVNITGNDQRYFASIVDSPHPGLDVRVSPGSNEVLVIAGKDTEGGNTYTTKVEDTIGHSKTFTISVTSIEATPSTDTPAATTCNDGVLQFNAEEVCLVQRLVGVKVTGSFDSGTCEALRSAWSTKLKLPEGGFTGDFQPAANRSILINKAFDHAGLQRPASPAERSKVIANAGKGCQAHIAPPPNTATPPVASGVPCTGPKGAKPDTFECHQITIDKLKDLQKRLSALVPEITASGEFDEVTRLGILKFTQKHELPESNTISEPLMRALDTVLK